MQAAKVRVVVAACLFLAWMGWLTYLVINTHDIIVLSRPQLLVADLWVVADLKEKNDAPAAEVTITRVIWPDHPDPDLPPGPLSIKGLAQITAEEGWAGPGSYLLPLSRNASGKPVIYQVTPVPPRESFGSQHLVQGERKPRIYLATPEVLDQANELRSGKE